MRLKKVLALAMVSVMLLSTAGCSKGDDKAKTTDGEKVTTTVEGETKDVATEAPATEAPAPETEAKKYDTTLTIEFFDKVANYQGIQGGWFGKYLKDKFNLEVNIIAPNIAGGGDTLYQTRSAAGNLGDLIIVSKSQLKDCIEAGIIKDLTEYMPNAKYLNDFQVAIDAYKKYLGTDKVYGIPARTSLLSPLTPKTFGTSPSVGNFMRFDYYNEIGAPKLNNEDDLLNALKAMQEKHPVSDLTGGNVYAFCLFKDWDSIYMKYPITMISNYGFTPGQEGKNFVLMNHDVSETQPIDQDGGVYYNQLKLLFKANQMGLVDPDSSSMTWDMLTEKTRNGEVLWSMWPWASICQFNTPDYSNQGVGFMHVPVASQTIIADGCSPYGEDAVFALGANCKEPERVFEFLDWLASAEYAEIRNAGLRGVTWDVVDGKCKKTAIREEIDKDPENALAPDSIGGGNYFDGGPQFNTAIHADNNINPSTGETFTMEEWESIVKGGRKKIDEDWTKTFGKDHPVQYCKDNNLLVVAPGNEFTAPADSSDIQTKRAMCGETVTSASWNMVFASDEAEFDAIWKEMKETLKGLGYDEVLAVDYANAEGIKQARAASLAAGK